MLTNGLLDDSIGALNPLALVALQPNAPTPQRVIHLAALPTRRRLTRAAELARLIDEYPTAEITPRAIVQLTYYRLVNTTALTFSSRRFLAPIRKIRQRSTVVGKTQKPLASLHCPPALLQLPT